MAGCAVWLTGLPGCGKSTIACAVVKALHALGRTDAHLLSMDERRRTYVPRPTYTPDDRATAYRLFAEEAAAMTREGSLVVMDATGHRKAMRDYARSLIPCFGEIHLQCSLQTAIERESNRPDGIVMAGLYEKALERRETGQDVEGLGEVIGVDIPYEENPAAELHLAVEEREVEDSRDAVLELIRRLEAAR